MPRTTTLLLRVLSQHPRPPPRPQFAGLSGAGADRVMACWQEGNKGAAAGNCTGTARPWWWVWLGNANGASTSDLLFRAIDDVVDRWRTDWAASVLLDVTYECADVLHLFGYGVEAETRQWLDDAGDEEMEKGLRASTAGGPVVVPFVKHQWVQNTRPAKKDDSDAAHPEFVVVDAYHRDDVEVTLLAATTALQKREFARLAPKLLCVFAPPSGADRRKKGGRKGQKASPLPQQQPVATRGRVVKIRPSTMAEGLIVSCPFPAERWNGTSLSLTAGDTVAVSGIAFPGAPTARPAALHGSNEPAPVLSTAEDGETTTSATAHETINMCIAPIFGQGLDPAALAEFIEYHFMYGVTHFDFYDGGFLSPDVRKVLRYYGRRGVVTRHGWQGVGCSKDTSGDLRYTPSAERAENCTSANHVVQYRYHGQDLAIHDCFLRSERAYSWIVFGDIDEVLFAPGRATWLQKSLFNVVKPDVAAYIIRKHQVFCGRRPPPPTRAAAGPSLILGAYRRKTPKPNPGLGAGAHVKYALRPQSLLNGRRLELPLQVHSVGLNRQLVFADAVLHHEHFNSRHTPAMARQFAEVRGDEVLNGFAAEYAARRLAGGGLAAEYAEWRGRAARGEHSVSPMFGDDPV